MKKYLAILLVVLLCFISVEVLAKSKKAGKKMNYTYGTKTFNTPEAYSLPSSYFLDLRGIYKTATTQQYTADVAILHNIQGHTITLNDIDETNNVGTAGPIAGGRDQADEFATGWVHFFFIYNPVTGDVSSLSSASPTAPTLPAGYTFFVRVGAAWAESFTSSSVLRISYQMGDRAYYTILWNKWDTHPASNPTAISVASLVPTTAKLIHGVMGMSAGAAARKMRVSADAAEAIAVGALCDNVGTGDANYGVSGSKDFTLPILGSSIYWSTETTADEYAIGITGYTDDL